MSSYDKIEGFRYWDPESWRSFIREQIVPLYLLSQKLLRLGYEVASRTGNRKLSEIDSDMLKFLLGGVTEEGDYEENSLALFVSNAFGVSIDAEHYVALAKEGVNPLEHIQVQVDSDTQFLSFLREISSLSGKIAGKAGVEVNENNSFGVEELIKDPDKILQVLRDFYEKILKVTANYNYYTFFALSTRNLPFFYLMEAYPRLKDSFDGMKSFLGLRPVFEPATEITEIRNKYTIWGHSVGGLLDLLFHLNWYIWESFKQSTSPGMRDSLSEIFRFLSPPLPDLKKEYLAKAEETLKLINWELHPYLQNILRFNYRLRFNLSGIIIIESWARSGSGGTWIDLEKYLRKSFERKSIADVLYVLAPALFLGVLVLKEIKPSYIEFEGIE
uniref:Uncharacterized protein n=1 Tax=Thermofilum adornatum TaxID=1365176 RepID=A0A7C1GC02_9CREN